MTAVMRRLACLLLVFIAIPLASADLRSLASAAYEYRNGLYNVPATDLDAAEAHAELQELAAGPDQAAAEKLAESMIPAGYEDYQLWMSLIEIKTKLSKGLEAAYAAFIATEAAFDSQQKSAAYLALGRTLEGINRGSEALEAYDEAVQLTQNPDARAAYQRLSRSIPFHYEMTETSTDGDRPQVCLKFDRRVLGTRQLAYDDYVRVEPETQVAYRALGRQLCLDGLSYGSSYQVTLKSGMPGEIGALEKDEAIDVAIGDREPSVGFQKQAYVLPKVGSTGVPLTSVNVGFTKLKLLRINDRNLVNEINRGNFLSNLYDWDRQRVANESGEQIWQGSMPIEGARNVRVLTSVPVIEMVPEIKPGVYLLMARAAQPDETEEQAQYYWDQYATQWIVVSDIGLTTLSGEDGLNVFVRSLETAEPLNRVRVQLLARNNEVLSETATDRDGRAHFDRGLIEGAGGRTATAVTAFRRDGDFSFLDLTRAAYDLSDRGVGGRVAPANLDLFLYTDRGVYRPGETVHLGALLRDWTGKSVADLPITLRLVRPDGVEAQRFENLKDEVGGFQQDIAISEAARTGQWTVEAFIDPHAPAIASQSFLVEEVVPARIGTKLTASAAKIVPGESLTVTGDAKFLYGAPAADLKVKSDLVVRPDANPFPQWEGYRFGLEEEQTDPMRVAFADVRTGGNGAFALPVALEEVPDVQAPLKATLRVEVYEFGGRPVIESVDLPVREKPLYLGIKPLFPEGQVSENSSAQFEIIALDAEGKEKAIPELQYRLVREEWRYNWFYAGGAWDYHVSINDGPAEVGTIAATANGPAKLEKQVQWGNFRLEVYDPATGVASSMRFHAGWSAKPGSGESPDRLQVVSDKEKYLAGETAQIQLRAPFAGEALITVATDRVLSTRVVSLPAEGKVIEIEVDPQWGAGAYVLASAFRPGREQERGPGRAVGVAWLAVDSAPRTIQVAMQVPDKVLPRQKVEIPITLSNFTGAAAYLTVAAVDEGILTLTDFETPDPVEHFFGKKRLQVELRDLYGQLIDGKAGRRGQIREGGDSEFSQRGAPKKIELVALYSGLVEVGQDGKAIVAFDIPDYNGRLRLMAVAYDAQNVGWAEAGLVVRDPVIAEISAPRFLAPGDKSNLSLTLQNLDGAAGRYEVAFSSSGDVQLGENASAEVELAQGATTHLRLALLGQRVGSGEITLSLKGPGDYVLDRSVAIPVRPANTPVTETLTMRLLPGESMTLNQAALDPFLEGASLRASFSTTPNLDVQTILANLEHYPYGCLEQTISRAYPLLLAGDVADLWALEDRYKQIDKAQLEKAIRSTLNRQRFDGMFGLWTAFDPAEPWLSAFTMDFLMRAKEKGFAIPPSAIEQGMDGLRKLSTGYSGVSSDDDRYGRGPSAQAYAHYVLARAGQAKLADLRYAADQLSQRSAPALALAHLAAALAMNGEQQRATELFDAATKAAERRGYGWWDYGSRLRDMAAVAFLIAESKQSGLDPTPLIGRVADMQGQNRWLSTQEQVWVLLAAKATAGQATGLKLDVSDGVSVVQDKTFYMPAAMSLPTAKTYTNSGSVPVYAKASVTGVPRADLPPADEGFAITRTFYTPDGTEAELSQVKQNDLLVVVLKGRATSGLDHQALITDLLPAGFEAEIASLASARQTGDYSWLPELSQALYLEYRDDRFVAAFDVYDEGSGGQNRDFTFAYLVRAVTPGDYKVPAPTIEDMYKPNYRGRGSTARTQIGMAE
ncbi:alpha-2-macroglobulin family protein [Dongia deserti]|uniref:alpha-2-macroglobulin family protein n=1 Tax=Dongia deserti TaxID=2268030 RepID=UPI0013C4B6E0|nr:alpha-2-macroglobulin [Dongia deserti]